MKYKLQPYQNNLLLSYLAFPYLLIECKRQQEMGVADLAIFLATVGLWLYVGRGPY